MVGLIGVLSVFFSLFSDFFSLRRGKWRDFVRRLGACWTVSGERRKKKENRRMDAGMKGQIRIISCVLLVLPVFLFFPEEE